MNNAFIKKILEIYNLVELQKEPQQIHGGLLHKMWKLETANGNFALKVLNPEIMNKVGILEEYTLSEVIAEQVHMQGINSVFALRSIDNNLVEKIDSDYIILYPWLEGETLKAENITIEKAKKIGEILAKLHSIKLDAKNFKKPQAQFVSIEKWSEFQELVSKSDFSWKENFNSLLPQIINLTPDIIGSINKMLQKTVVSHSDLDAKNVIWVHNDPYLIDWESAGYVNPGSELASLALDWSFGISKENFTGVIYAYREILPLKDSQIIDGLLGAINNKLRWLEFNIKRALGLISNDKEEIALGNSECIKTIEDIRKTIDNMEVYKRWI